MTAKRSKTIELLKQADAALDWFAVQEMDLLTKLGRQILPRGFWGDGHSANSAEHPESSESRIYLTFDDGPSEHTTPWLLELLEKEGVKASFFLIGQAAEKHPDLVKAIQQGGHSIGNHSYSHMFMPMLDQKVLENEVERTNTIIESITSERPQIFRPPYGIICNRSAQVLKEHSMHPVYWSQATRDWSNPGAHKVVRRLLMNLKPGNLIVLHEGKELREQTLKAAKEIIYRCKSSEFDLEKVQLGA